MRGGRLGAALEQGDQGELVVGVAAGPAFVHGLAGRAQDDCRFGRLVQPAEAGEGEDGDQVAAQPVGRFERGARLGAAQHPVRLAQAQLR